MKIYKKIISVLEIFLVISLIFSISLSISSKEVYAEQVCCEKTKTGQYCESADSTECAAGAARAPTSCEQTSFCKSGCCAGLGGYCYNNYPKALCEKQYGGSFSDDPSCSVSECKQGCCVIGTQASLLTKGRCLNETSKFPDLQVDFRDGIQDEASCLDIARNTEKGCCVSGSGCSYGPKSECNVETSVNQTGFYKDKFCSSLKGLCNCAPADHSTEGKGNTMCLPNDDSVYWKDSCGNPEGVKEKCDYSKGTLCGDSDKDGGYTCESLKCEGQGVSTERSKKISVNLLNYHGTSINEIKANEILNGESWCQADSKEQDDNLLFGRDTVGSRYYRSLCINGGELIEPCKDFRQEFCYSASVEVPRKDERGNDIRGGQYTEARCLKNEWQSCIDSCNTADSFSMKERDYKEALEKDQRCCDDRSKRDCRWTGSKCAPAVSPGAKFWEGEGSDTCGKANLECTAFFVCGGWNKLFGLCEDKAGAGAATGAIAGIGAGAATLGVLGVGAAAWPFAIGSALVAAAIVGGKASISGWKLVSGKECFSQDYLQAANNLCRSYGDCGTDYNYLVDDSSVPVNLKLARYGFSNTERIDEELAGVIRGEAKEGEHKGLSYVYGKEKNQVPGNLSGEPKWDEGETFFNFGVVGKKNRANKFTRAFFLGDEESAVSRYRAGIYGGGIALAGILALGTLGAGAEIGTAGAGLLGVTPHTYLLKFIITLFPKVEGTAFAKGLGDAFVGTQNDILLKKGIEAGANADGLTLDIAKEAIAKQAKDELLKLKVAAAQEELEVAGQEAIKAAETAASKGASISTGAGFLAALNSVMWAYTIFELGNVLGEKVQPVTVKATCQPWQAPALKITEKDQCQRCNEDFGEYLNNDKTPKDARALKACSEYRCKSLGASCSLINKGTNEEQCVSLSKYDVNTPVIKPWTEGFSKELKERVKETSTGFRIEGKIPIYERFLVALQTNEPSQCKMSFEHSKRYSDMENTFFMSNTFKYFHLQEMFYPASKNATSEGLKLQGGGDYKLYVRCQDAVGNANEKDYVIDFSVEDEPDLTAPSILGTNIGQEAYLTHGTNQTDVTLFVNEPAECKWSLTSLEYSAIQEENKCVASRLNSLGLYECQYIGDGIIGSIGPAIKVPTSRAGETRYIYFKCQDKSEKKNFNKEAFRLTLRGSDPLKITSQEPQNIIKTSLSLTNLTLKVKTEGGAKLDGNAVCKYTQQESLQKNLGAMTHFLYTNSSIHTQPWTPPTGKQIIYTGCYDLAGNNAFTTINFTIESDVAAPKITKVYKDESLQPSAFTIEVSEKAACKDSTEGTFEYNTGGNLMVADGNVHRTSTPGSNLYYVICRDDFGNTMETARIQFA